MPGAFPAVKASPRNFEVPAAVERVLRADDPRFQPGEGDHHLEGRAGRVDALHRFRGERAILVLGQGAIVADGDAPDKEVGIERGRGADREHVARGYVHHDGGGAFAFQSRLNVGLQLVVDGQLQVFALNPCAAVQLAHLAPDMVDLNPPRTGLAAQSVLHLGFQTDLADLEPRDQQQLVGGVDLGQIVVRDRADVADHMCIIGGLRIGPGQPDLGGDTGQGGGVDGDLSDIGPLHLIRDGHGKEWLGALQLGGDALHFFVIERQERAEALHDRVDIARILTRQGDPVGGVVDGDGRAVAVKDFAACGRNKANVDAVLFGQQAELVGFFDLHVAHAKRQQSHETRLRAADDQRAAVQLARTCGGILVRTFHMRCPNVSTSPGATRRTPKSTAQPSTING